MEAEKPVTGSCNDRATRNNKLYWKSLFPVPFIVVIVLHIYRVARIEIGDENRFWNFGGWKTQTFAALFKIVAITTGIVFRPYMPVRLRRRREAVTSKSIPEIDVCCRLPKLRANNSFWVWIRDMWTQNRRNRNRVNTFHFAEFGRMVYTALDLAKIAPCIR